DNVFWSLASDALKLWAAHDEGIAPSAPTVAPVRIRPGNAARAKNIITLVLESTSALRTSAYGASPDTTPFLRSLVERGTRVDVAYTVVPHTSKALVSIHCGIYPRIWPSIDEAKAAGIPSPCLPRLLREEGFATAYFQAAEENYERRADLVREFGFERFAGKESLPSTGFDESSYFGFEDRVLVGPVLEWIDAHRDQRFYVSVLTLASHHPYFVPAGWERRALHKQPALNDYLNTLRYVDDVVAQLFAGLEARGLLEDTLVIITGDHGEGFGEHGRQQHDAVIYEEGLRVPLLLVGAGAEPGAKVSGLWQSIDILPTALDALGFAPEGPLEGRSVFTRRGHEALFFSCHHYNYCMALRREDRKFVYHYARRSPEVFDLASDPSEQQNLLVSDIADEIVPEFNLVLAEMKRRKQETDQAYLASQRSRVELFVKRTPPPYVGRPLDVVFEEGVRLLGYDVSPSVFEAGDKVVVTLYYQVERELPLGFEPYLHIKGPYPIKTNQVPVEGAYPASSWRSGDFIEDRHTLSTRPDWAVGDYTLVTGLHRKVAGGTLSRSVPTVTTGVQLVPEGISLPGFTMTKPHLDASAFVTKDAAPPEASIDVQFGPCIQLVATDIDKPKVSGGLKTTVTHTFAARCNPEDGLRMVVQLDGPTPKQFEHAPVNGNYGLAQWQTGDVVIDPMAIITHTRDRRGIYRVLLGVRRADGTWLTPTGSGLPVRDSMIEVGQYRLVD
ncbi:MAG: sulfatase, partial [Myxococcota bacterium]